ncbi:phosphate acyltransferase PlsX [Paramaledivibacter caminithermalis]|jgi:glycerol-3-phosphate acyltransferase PlsX|uniref:Phosphate acyltransferase n=1 Tax=Paramaledivibacter caminithermalis (strain DSM 15212 / CIP 107654 / DViRD3) TaxID=1121301 RepID=A0A1M6NIS4_PARC5|nr:phosphate acyltransferase PlsX [Paramaledivibacter caminithermalis]SHJ95635.1 phosphate:acyl-[acyl carrier protein] acyltransferase [Paramaledivibacter caminithermalis DSM 15212]
MRIAIDVMGGDNAPHAIILGSLQALNEIESEILLVGKEEIIKNQLEKNTKDFKRIHIINADEIISNDDKAVQAIRKKKNSSMAVGFDLLRKNEVDAFVSAGNTGALLAGSLLRIGRIKGIDRPALAPIYPTKKGFSILIDAGANADCKPRNLLEFGIMGSIYLENVLNIKTPKVGLVNIGTEEGKGNKLVAQAYELMRNSNLNFYGNLEARNVPDGIVDVIVCDGFVGNVILKLTEGVAMNLASILKDIFTRNFISKIGALILKDGLRDFKSRLDYTEYGGAPLLGVKKPVIKAHGSSNEKAIKNAIKYSEIFIKKGVIKKIEENIRGADNIE